MTTIRNPAMDASFKEELLDACQGGVGPRYFSNVATLKPEPYDWEMSDLATTRQVVRRYEELGSVVLKQYTLKHRIQRQWIA